MRRVETAVGGVATFRREVCGRVFGRTLPVVVVGSHAAPGATTEESSLLGPRKGILV